MFDSRHKTRKIEGHVLFIVSVYVSSISRKIVSKHDQEQIDVHWLLYFLLEVFAPHEYNSSRRI
jgi:hypothetical protein